eukprot:COSAG06_NODE_18749_length_870_cov_38.552529_1_plen_104_part_10
MIILILKNVDQKKPRRFLSCYLVSQEIGLRERLIVAHAVVVLLPALRLGRDRADCPAETFSVSTFPTFILSLSWHIFRGGGGGGGGEGVAWTAVGSRVSHLGQC